MQESSNAACTASGTRQSASGAQMPLAGLGAGDCGQVVRVRGRGDLPHHLENLGFVEGAEVKVVSGVAGDLIVEVKGAQVAVSRQAASHVMVSPSV